MLGLGKREETTRQIRSVASRNRRCTRVEGRDDPPNEVENTKSVELSLILGRDVDSVDGGGEEAASQKLDRVGEVGRDLE